MTSSDTLPLILEKINYYLNYTVRGRFKKKKKESITQQNMRKWFKDNNEFTLRYTYDLTQDSIVFDIGGYKGEWAARIYCKYQPKIYLFEPVAKFANETSTFFRDIKKVKVYNIGLSNKSEKKIIYLNKDRSSVFGTKNPEEIQLLDIKQFLEENAVETIHLMKINIEGGEYDLLNRLIVSGLINNILNIQVQFHDFFPDALDRMNSIKRILKETHLLTYEYPFVWENWKRRV